MAHDLEVTYTIDDDGIWLNCRDCDFSYAVGMNPTVDALQREQFIHRKVMAEVAEDATQPQAH